MLSLCMLKLNSPLGQRVTTQNTKHLFQELKIYRIPSGEVFFHCFAYRLKPLCICKRYIILEIFFFLSLTHIVLWHFTTYLLACDSPHIYYTEHYRSIQVKNTLLMQIRVSKICHGMFVLAINQHILQPLFRLSKLFVECNLYLGHVLL